MAGDKPHRDIARGYLADEPTPNEVAEGKGEPTSVIHEATEEERKTGVRDAVLRAQQREAEQQQAAVRAQAGEQETSPDE